MPTRNVKIDLAYRPRLADLRPLITPTRSLLEARATAPRVTAAKDLQDRRGYAEDFLGSFGVPWPTLDPAQASDAQPGRLDYTHFSISMSRSRRLALCVGVNIDGAKHVDIVRSNDTWAYDGRLPIDAQVGEDLYAGNGLDRGHLVRRQDPNWGDDANTANGDTFHFTNCSPQMSGFNQKTWLELEDYILDNNQRWKARASVFTGPVFADDDRLYRGVKIPKAFWKVVAYLSDDGKPSASAYMIDQSRELGQLDLVFGPLRTYQRSVIQIEQLTGIHFGNLADYDGFSNEERATGTRIEALIREPGDIRL
ncbi:DNA/RNA non-specific endonuclease [Pseudomonas sp. R5-89-07]|uniref:DNA/RNA non-specific endonuclease n=1 Tax=Pseudomonas sp. R5-89-07 TaxID=658644 RepID=UPI000F5621A3|nr:DNA/RNA non-specific endonuclease [Pseudomonas sp. R5-89-07]AZF06366.1 DNA/RNA non-specific endonuclease [Pseudomonas sp. R5-89-07]